ncbi:MAG: hypothetical protein HYR80_10190 [Nitrospirae bacterium]|nr:hypothetical protein [Nitrospirota bacterium]
MSQLNRSIEIIQWQKRLHFLTVIPTLFLFLFLSVSGVVHIYTYNELWEDGGCTIGALFCHGQTEGSATCFFTNPLQFRNLLVLASVHAFPFSFFHDSPQRAPPHA